MTISWTARSGDTFESAMSDPERLPPREIPCLPSGILEASSRAGRRVRTSGADQLEDEATMPAATAAWVAVTAA